MKISSMEEYGVRCLLRIAGGDEHSPVSAQTIALAEGISVPYAQKVVRELVQSGLVDSKRGAHGGYYLARPLGEITLGDAMRALGGTIVVEDLCERHAGDRKVCEHFCDCSIRPVWRVISEFVIQTTDSIPLALLMRDESTVATYLSGLRASGIRGEEAVGEHPARMLEPPAKRPS